MPALCHTWTKTGWDVSAQVSEASQYITSPDTTTRDSRLSSRTTAPSISNRCTPTRKRCGSQTGNMTTPTGTKTRHRVQRRPTTTRRTASLTNGTHLYSAYTENSTIASMPTRDSELSMQHVSKASPPNCSSSLTKTTGC